MTGHETEPIPQLTGKFPWLRTLKAVPDVVFRDRCGMDAYLFDRFLNRAVIFFGLMTPLAVGLVILNWYSHPERDEKLSLSRLGWSGGQSKAVYLSSHLIVSTIISFTLCVGIFKEYRRFLHLRQNLLWSDDTEHLVYVPSKLTSSINRPGGRKNWFAGAEEVDIPHLQARRLVAARQEAARDKLEIALTGLIRTSMKNPDFVDRTRRARHASNSLSWADWQQSLGNDGDEGWIPDIKQEIQC